MNGYTVVHGDFSAFEEALKGRVMLMIVIGTTDTSLIPGITIAGASPELTHYTPAADVEYLLTGSCKVIPVIPMTPDGKPTPALLTRSMVRLTGVGVMVANAGVRVRPNIPYIDLQGEPGGDIRRGAALSRGSVERIVENGLVLGHNLGRALDLLMLGESIPAGTTTAMAFLVAMGYDAWNKMSSASPVNPRELKVRVVSEALRNAGISSPLTDPIEAVSRVGDPVIPAMASIAVGASRSGARVILAGGTQMAAVLAFIKAYDKGALGNVAVATTRWIIGDKTADLPGLVNEIAGVPLVYSNVNLGDVGYSGLRAFEEGYVKEGVGAGGSMVMAAARGFKLGEIKRAIVDEYEGMLKMAGVKPQHG